MKLPLPRLAGLASLLLLCQMAALGAPFAEKVPFTQPDGTQIVLWGQGDEFYAVFETLDGYTVSFNQQTKAYEYAALSVDGEQLITTGVAVGRGSPSALGLTPHVRINAKAIRKQVAENFARWDQAMEVTQRWSDLKTERRLAELYAPQAGPEPSPPSSTTTGQKLGLTILIDFSDAVATIPQANVISFCNGDGYTGYGNNGSVKKYYLDNSDNLLTYSNVVTIYIRAPQPKTYYDDTSILFGTQGRLLITEAIAAMKALPNYTSDILPTFSDLTVDGSSRVVACNVFFAGANSGVWNYGLWPHSYSLASAVDLGNGKKVYKYQITNIGSALTLGTFCHENGHMLCGFPDIYDYDYDSKGGAGVFCLMGYGNYSYNPAQICAYLKRAAGWATTIALTSSSNLTASVSASGTDFNKFYRFPKPGVATEYFLVENRQKSGHDANLPASGVAIWHIDELGNKNYQNTNFNTTHTNYEVSLMQADNLWHFQKNVNTGDSKDLYYLGNTATGYGNRFSDATSPSARWWNGAASDLSFHHFSASGTTMTFSVGAEEPTITLQPNSQTAVAGTNATFQVTATGAAPLVYQWRFNGTNLAGALNSVLTLTNVQAAQAGTYAVLVTNAGGSVLSSNAVLTVRDPWIIGQPESQSVTAGAPASFTVNAVGAPPLTYQWLKEDVALADGANITGAHTATLTVIEVQIEDLGNYSVAVSNVNGQVISSNATLVVGLPPVISTQPASQSVLAGSVVLFTAGVTGTSPISLQWQRTGANLADGAKISGATNVSLIVSNVQASEMGDYSLVASNAYGSVSSSNALLGLWPLVAWGRNNYTQADIPSALSNVVAVAGGLYHNLALRSEGAVVAWGAGQTNTGGNAQYGQAMVPDDLTNVVTLGAGGYHSLALRSDGTVAAWGAGTTNLGVSPHYGQAIVPVSMTNVVAVGGGGYHTLALTADGTVAAWGAGTTNTGISPHYGQAIVPGDLSNVVAMAAGSYHSLALKRDGTVVAWGAGTTNTGVNPHHGQAMLPDSLSNAVMVAAGGYHSLALTADGTVAAWGDNTYGQTNTPADLSNVVAVAAGRYYSLALKSDGTMVGWGDSPYGQTNPPVGLANVVGIGGGGFHAVALEGDGSPYITVQPFGQTVSGGATVRLLAMVVGLQPFSYQWRHNGTNLAGATSNLLTLASVGCSDAGAYTLLVSNALGSAPSSAAALTISETTPPTIACPADVTVPANFGCSATNVDLGSPVTGDNCGVAAVTNNALASYPVGTNVVTWTVSDTTGNTNSCQQRVIVLDSQPPTIAWHMTNVAAAAGTNCQALMPDMTGTNYIVVADNCGSVTVTQSMATDAVLSLGTNEVVLGAFDAAGNVAYCTNYVVVVDQAAPVIAWHMTNVVVAAGTNCQALMPNLTGANYIIAADNCSSVTVTQSVATDAVLSLGANEVVLGAFDAVGNAAYCTNYVVVLDQTPPTLTCPADLTLTNDPGQCGAVADYTAPVGQDNCSAPETTQVAGLVSGSLFPAGRTTNTFQVTDVAGNRAECSFVVTVDDAEAPLITWYMTNVVVAAGTNCQGFMPDMTGTNYIVVVDNCGSVMVTQSVAPDAVLGLGTNEVVLGAFDAAGNVAYWTNYIAVLDQTPPAITCPANMVVSADAGQCSASNVTWEVTASDNCVLAGVASEPPSGSTLPAGVTTVTCTATDASGNTNWCSFTVTVAAPPYILAHPVSQTVAQGQDATFTASATNNCGSALVYQWRWNGGEIAGATDSAYTRTNVQCADAGSFELVVASLADSQTSSVANLTVVAPPVILSGPADQTVSVGQEAAFMVTATNDCGGELAYQWRFNGVEILGATTNYYTFTTWQLSNRGNYDIVVSNLAAAVTSPAAVLTIAGPYLSVYPAELSQTGSGTTSFALVFPSVAGIDYAVQYKDTLADTSDWLPLMTNPGTGDFVTNDFPIATGPASRFYRILVR